MRKFKNILFIVILIIAVCWLLQMTKLLPSFKTLFTSKQVLIDETPVLIKDIKSVGQLVTYSFFDEVVADSAIVTGGSAFVNAFNRLAPVPLLPSADKQLVLIGKGKVIAGTDLSSLSDTSVIIKKDTVIVYLPKPKIFAVILNPGDFETFIEKGNWTSHEVTQVKLKARRKIEEHAVQQNILYKAGEKSKAVIRDFLENMGYKKVIVF